MILLIFGGETLRGFSVAMLVGIISGTYSTIFIAVPMVLDLGNKSSKNTPAVAETASSKKVVQ
jgi:SecD/SecF fusion protein